MGKTKKKKDKESGREKLKIGFVPDFSLYLDKYFPIEKTYNKPASIEKLGNIMKEIITEENPAFELQKNGFCSKFEKMSPGQDEDFFSKLAIIGEKAAIVHPYYSLFGNKDMVL